ncbi:MAG: ATP-binding protein [Chitinispirillia bacterium]|nr:ATP-binding protein [Chitinispirillia bacterium]MCL2242357.1 ATP-binding protein [Chitinispirillia bacterium]
MSVLTALIKRLQAAALALQVTFVALAFAAMALSGYFFGVYFHNARGLKLLPITLGILFTVILSYILISLNRAKQREERAARDTIREADERAIMMLDAAPVGITLWDRNFNLIDFNYEAARVVGINSKREYRERFMETAPEYQPDGQKTLDKVMEVISTAFEKGHARTVWNHNHVNGETIPFDATAIPLKYKGEDVIMVCCRDIRESLAIMEEMHRAEVAEASSEAKSRFLAAMSHEIRTPMNVILGVTEIQLMDKDLEPHLREAFMQIYSSSDLLLGIINDILDLSKIDAGKMEFTPAKYELASLINDTVHLNIMRNSKPIEFKLEVDENARASLCGDELRIKQIMNNLLSNAFKFTDKGTIRLTVSTEENGGAENDVTLAFTVSDTGQGMTAEQLEKLFTEFTRFNLNINRTIQGTGLGMNITQRLVNMMGGDIKVDSVAGTGTTVSVRLPQKSAGSERIGSVLAENLRMFRLNSNRNMNENSFTREYMPYGKILLVDDVESNLYVAKGLMAPYGLTIDTAASGESAISKIQSGKTYDIIFMDHMMPGMDGIEAANAIRKNGYAHPIVALTANAVVGQAEIFLNRGFNDFISKPIDIRQLNATLNKFIRDKQPPEAIEKARKERDSQKNARTPAAAAPELLAIFTLDAKKALPALESISANAANAGDNDINLFTLNAHAMKSALANIGETKTSQAALALENAGRAGDRAAIAANTQGFLHALRKIIAQAEAASISGNGTLRDEDTKTLREQLAIIAKACNDYNNEAIDSALDRLKKMTWSKETSGTLEAISLRLLRCEFGEAAKTAEEYLAKL